MAIICYAGQSFLSVIQSELIPLWAATPLNLGGLAFNSSDIGTLMAFGGASLLFIQLIVYVPVQRQIGTLALYRKAYVAYSLVVLLYPATYPFATHNLNWLLWASLFLLTALRTGCHVFAVTSINILLAETCSNKKTLGKINGISQTSGSLMRAIGPTFCGIVFSWSLTNNFYFPLLRAPLMWIVLSLIALINYFLGCKLAHLLTNSSQ
ncbi:hypothetical protein DSO57_1005381 [Entomophthora muscae]|uniref:Uncharacterized protein n=1 Tax=Entomophthora muscae TaxID=34485 RepID=A0ACC2RZ07_9FUNG|nr:hypothetical protein DSO57_1005381 [Entomophthora muscae]